MFLRRSFFLSLLFFLPPFLPSLPSAFFHSIQNKKVSLYLSPPGTLAVTGAVPQLVAEALSPPSPVAASTSRCLAVLVTWPCVATLLFAVVYQYQPGSNEAEAVAGEMAFAASHGAVSVDCEHA